MRIGKNHEIFSLIKNIERTNKYPNLVISDDLEILDICHKYNLNILYLLYVDEIEYQEKTALLLDDLKLQAKECYEISKKTYEMVKTKENHAGILAIIELKQYSPDDLGDFVVILDHLEIPGNIGTLYRTFDACGVSGIIFTDAICKRHNNKILASSRGTNLIIPTLDLTYQETLNFLTQRQFNIYLGEPKLGKDYQAYDYVGKTALIIGNERFGINNDWYNHPHNKVFIPMKGNNNSLNVGVAGSIIAYEIAMKKKFFQ